MIFSFLALLAQDVPRQEIPLRELKSDGYTFVCAEKGLPTLAFDYRNETGFIRFTYTDGDNVVVLALRDAVKSAFYESKDGERRWTIHAEGKPQNPVGIPGTSGSIDLVIRLDAERIQTADFTAKAGGLARSYSRCGSGPRIVTVGKPE